ncbi:MAG TPA: hypothetical protein VH987_03685 [Candidatus Limnocylindria bacterium]|jgi:hypothetical protein
MARRFRTRIAAALGAGAAASILTAATALAGGWANAVMDEPPADPPGSGNPLIVGFTLLQHGETPVDWGSPTVTLTEATTGESVSAVARPDGARGHWSAELAVPRDGTWQWTVRHDLEIVLVGFEPLRIGASDGTTAATTAGAQPALLVTLALLGSLAALVLAATAITLRSRRRQPASA